MTLSTKVLSGAAAAAFSLTLAVSANAQTPSPKPVLIRKGTTVTAKCAAWRGKIATGGSTTTAATGVAPNSQTPPLAQQQTQATTANGATVTTNGKTVTSTVNRGTVAAQTRTCKAHPAAHRTPPPPHP